MKKTFYIIILTFILIIFSGKSSAVNTNYNTDIDNNLINIAKTKTVIKPRCKQDGILLNNGEVLITGGIQDSPYIFAELYNQQTDTYREPNQNIKEEDININKIYNYKNHTSILLKNGNVLIIGGYKTKPLMYYTKEEKFIKLENAPDNFLYDISYIELRNSDILIFAGFRAYKFNQENYQFTEIKLPDNIIAEGSKKGLVEISNGDILIFGSGNHNSRYTTNDPLDRVYRYSIQNDTFEVVGYLKDERENYVHAIKIDNDNILVWGGYNKKNEPVNTIEKYNINTNTSEIIGQIKGTHGLESDFSKLNNDIIITGNIYTSDDDNSKGYIVAYSIKNNKSFLINKIIQLYLPYKYIKLTDGSLLILTGSDIKHSTFGYYSKYSYKLSLQK